MNTIEKDFVEAQNTSRMPILDKEHGFYNSTTINLTPQEVFSFWQDEENVEKVLMDLPKGIENFLDLSLISAENTDDDEFEIHWENKTEAKIQGTLSFILRKAPADRGTILSAVAIFDKFNWNDEGPSTLMNIFLRRMKALSETGVLATTKGQPSGREELTEKERHTLQ
jgi:hypothetical protein